MADNSDQAPQDDRAKVSRHDETPLASHGASYRSLHDPLQRQAWLESLSPEELEAVRVMAWDKVLRSRKVNVNGTVSGMVVFGSPAAATATHAPPSLCLR